MKKDLRIFLVALVGTFTGSFLADSMKKTGLHLSEVTGFIVFAAFMMGISLSLAIQSLRKK